MSPFLGEDILCQYTLYLRPASMGILQMLSCSSPKAFALPLLLLLCCHLEVKLAGKAQLLPLASPSQELWAASQLTVLPLSQRCERSIIMHGFSSLLLRYQPSYMIFGPYLHLLVSCQEMSISGSCSFWLNWTSGSNSCQCHFLESDVIKSFTSWRLASFVVKSYPMPPVNQQLVRCVRSCVRVGMFGTGETSKTG